MIAEKVEIETGALADRKQHAAFFRQSSWMMIATVGNGILMALVHGFSKVLPAEEYTALGAMITAASWLGFPALALQLVFARQTSAVITEEQKRDLVGTFRAVFKAMFCIWLVLVVGALIFHNRLVIALKLNNPAGLWITVVIGLVGLWLPIFMGLLQGRQNFLWLGWVILFNGLGRIVIAGLIVYLLHGQAAGIMTGALIGVVAALAVGFWQNRDLAWHAPAARFEGWKAWLLRGPDVLPLTIGICVFQIMFTADVFVVQNYLGEDGKAAPYMFGGTLARAIVYFTAPLVSVMFPKLVHSAARSQKTNLLALTLGGTAVLSCMAAIGLTIVAPWVIRLGSRPENLSIVPLMPLFAWTMVPLTLANVLLNNLLAHGQFKIVPALIVLVACYFGALLQFHDSFKMVIQTMAVFNLLLLAACAFFTWLAKDKARMDAASA